MTSGIPTDECRAQPSSERLPLKKQTTANTETYSLKYVGSERPWNTQP